MELKKIRTQEEIATAEKKKIRWISGILLFILIASTLGFALMSGEKTTNNQNQAVASNGKFMASFGSNTLYFTNNMSDIENVSIDVNRTLNDFYGNRVYLDTNNSYVYSEIYSILGNYVQKITIACYGSCEKDLPEKSCNDTIIVFRQAAENKVYENGNCTFIEGDLKAVDAFLYKTFGFY